MLSFATYCAIVFPLVSIASSSTGEWKTLYPEDEKIWKSLNLSQYDLDRGNCGSNEIDFTDNHDNKPFYYLGDYDNEDAFQDTPFHYYVDLTQAPWSPHDGMI